MTEVVGKFDVVNPITVKVTSKNSVESEHELSLILFAA